MEHGPGTQRISASILDKALSFDSYIYLIDFLLSSVLQLLDGMRNSFS